MKAPKEGDTVKACLTYLCGVRRWRCWRNNTGALPVAGRFVRFGAKGSADILGVIPPAGRLLAIECKRQDGKVRLEQVAWLNAAASAGALAIVVCSVDDLRRQLAEAGYPEGGEVRRD